MREEKIDLFQEIEKIEWNDLTEKSKNYLKEWEIDMQETNFFKKTISFQTELFSLPFSDCDMRGDGQTNVVKTTMDNLEVIHTVVMYMVGSHLCKKIDPSKPAYVLYELDQDRLLLEMI